MEKQPQKLLPTELLINYETGEITGELFPGDKISIMRQSQEEYLSSHIINFNSEKTFVKIYDEVIPLLEKYLSLPEFKFAISLIPHISYEDCIIRRTMDRRSPILNVKEMVELHGYNYNYGKKLFLSLKKKGVVGRHETGTILNDCPQKINIVYTVNPFIYFRGSDLITPVHAFYQNSGWQKLLENSGEPS